MRENRTYGLTRGPGETLHEGIWGLLYDGGARIIWPSFQLTFEGTLEVFQGEGLPGERETNLKFGASPGRKA